jgi:hypothetical protein
MKLIPRRKKQGTRVSRQLAQGLLEDAMGRAERAIPAGARIFTSWSPKVRYAHVKSAVNLGSVCETFSTREEPWLGTGSDDEREHASSLPLCPKCAAAIGGETRTAS